MTAPEGHGESLFQTQERVTETLTCRTLKCLTIVRMGDGDEGFCTLRKILVPEIDTTLFSDNVLRLETGCDHPGSRSKVGDNLATAFGGA